MNDSATPLGSNRDRHANVLEGEMGKGLGVFLAHPAFQELAAYLETPGPNDEGPDASSIEALRALHRGERAPVVRHFVGGHDPLPAAAPHHHSDI